MSINPNLEELYDQDAQDRVMNDSGELDDEALEKQDKARLKEARKLLEAGEIALDEIWNCHYLCLLFMHSWSEDPEDFKKAHEFAKKAVGMGSKVTKWLYAASLDRWLISQGKLQKYGTQYNLETGYMLPCEEGTTDHERKKYFVAPLEELRKRY